MRDLQISLPKPCSEKWERMAPDGCNRFCSHCAKTIHDLSNCTPDEVDALLSSPEPVCVRAKLETDGSVETRAVSQGALRRVFVATSVSLGLMAVSNAAIATEDQPEGIIAGQVFAFSSRVTVTAIAADGTRREVKSDRKGRYRFKHLPPGKYDLEFSDGEKVWTGHSIEVEDGKITYFNSSDPNMIIVGVMSRALEVHS
jgi:hypothetical protein